MTAEPGNPRLSTTRVNGMEKWKSDLDALINDTMAFAAASQAAVSASRVAVVLPLSIPRQSTPMTTPPISQPSRDVQPNTRAKSEREEIVRRVASFKAHQERWTREREDYANSILKGTAR